MEDGTNGNLGVSDCVDNDTNPDQSSSKSKIRNDLLYCFESLNCV